MDWINSFFGWFAENKDGVLSLGVFVAATASIAGAVWTARISTKSARQEQLGKIRQIWVEDLRNDISTLLKVHTSGPDSSDATSGAKNFAASRILLRLTSGNECHEQLSKAVRKFVKFMSKPDDDQKTNQKEFEMITDDMIEKAKVVLKEAWDQAAGDLS